MSIFCDGLHCLGVFWSSAISQQSLTPAPLARWRPVVSFHVSRCNSQRVPPRLGRSAVRPICFSSLNDIRRASVGEMSRREKKLPQVGRARMHQNVGHFPSPPRHLPPAGYRRDPSQLIAGRLQTLTEDVHFYSMLLLILFLLRL